MVSGSSQCDREDLDKALRLVTAGTRGRRFWVEVSHGE